jgi:hypothetical protein
LQNPISLQSPQKAIAGGSWIVAVEETRTLDHDWGAVAFWRKRDKDAQALHADLVMLARLSQALSRARVVCLAA